MAKEAKEAKAKAPANKDAPKGSWVSQIQRIRETKMPPVSAPPAKDKKK